ncbi:MAG: hypothetical protein CMC88_03635 [Flavobacteriaceae bacterium]|nr:hypothetical protein [Flavobacteriaceae bacterium]|tara:strand:+ start:29915 stop:32008 length:2094 start_codon:yes stop_codon:yes gene_type:complete
MRKYLFLNLLIIFFSNCTKDYLLDVTVSPPLSGIVSPESGSYKEGSTVSIVATPNPEYEFVGWSGDETGSANLLSFEINSNKNIIAQFQKRKYNLKINILGEGTVSEEIISSSKNSDYESGTIVRLTAIPSSGYYFTGWSNDVSGDTNPVEININRAKTITAKFQKKSYSLEIKVEGDGTVEEEIVDTGKSTDYLFGTKVKLTPKPSEGWDFIKWKGDYNGEENPLEIIINKATNITANFEYGVFLESVGRWKLKKKKGSELPPIIDQKTLLRNNEYDVYDILFNRDYTFILNTNTGQISGTFDVISNTEIKLINQGTISNINVSNNQIEFRINISGKFRFDVTGQRDQNFQEGKIYIPDTNLELALIELGYDDIPDNYIDSNKVSEILFLDLSNKQLTDLTGLENFINIENLDLSSNQLTQVPIVNFTNLKSLNLNNNLFSVLDLSFNEKINSLNASNNPDLTCIKVGPSLYDNLPAGYVADQASFELECNCPTLTLTSGFNSKVQTLCSGEPMNTITYQLGGENVSAFVLDSNSLPLGVTSSLDDNTITISGTPFFDGSQDVYNIVINTSNTNTNCSQVSKTVVINKNIDSPVLTLDSGSPGQVAGSLLNLNQVSQAVCINTPIVPIIYSFSGVSNGVNVSGLPFGISAIVSNGVVTISGTHDQIGVYNFSVTTIGSNQCNELSAQGSIEYKVCD